LQSVSGGLVPNGGLKSRREGSRLVKKGEQTLGYQRERHVERAGKSDSKTRTVNLWGVKKNGFTVSSKISTAAKNEFLVSPVVLGGPRRRERENVSPGKGG